MQELLTAVHKFYPIGCPEIHRYYGGLKELKAIIIHKINDIEEDKKTPYSELVSSLRNHFSENEINDLGYLEFPSYFLTVEIKENIFNGIKSKVQVVIVISLLVNYYTIYFSNKYDLNNDEFFESKNKNFYQIIYFQSCNNEYLKKISTVIENEIKAKFYSYNFIHHFVLFDNIIKSGRTLLDLDNDSTGKNYCYYDYLFSIDMALKKDFKLLL